MQTYSVNLGNKKRGRGGRGRVSIYSLLGIVGGAPLRLCLRWHIDKTSSQLLLLLCSVVYNYFKVGRPSGIVSRHYGAASPKHNRKDLSRCQGCRYRGEQWLADINPQIHFNS